MRKEQLRGEGVFVIHDFLSADECAAAIARSEAAGFGDAPINSGSGFVVAKGVRDNDRAMIDDSDLAARLWERATPFVPAELDGWTAVGLNERFRSYRYGPGQFFAPHFDGSFVRSFDERSLLTFMVYLNADAAGGDTTFYLFEGDGVLRDNSPTSRVTPEPGKALVFKHTILHEGRPVMAGRKYVLRSDVMYRRPAR